MTDSNASEPKSQSLDLANKDKLKALELVYSFALTYSSSFNTVGAAVIFGLFSLLLLVSTSAFLSAAWLLLSTAYLLTVLTGVYFYLRAVRYTMMASEAAKRLGIIGLAEDVYKETPGASGFLVKTMAGRFEAYGVFTTAYFFFGPMLLGALWFVVAVLPHLDPKTVDRKPASSLAMVFYDPDCLMLIMKDQIRVCRV